MIIAGEGWVIKMMEVGLGEEEGRELRGREERERTRRSTRHVDFEFD